MRCMQKYWLIQLDFFEKHEIHFILSYYVKDFQFVETKLAFKTDESVDKILVCILLIPKIIDVPTYKERNKSQHHFFSSFGCHIFSWQLLHFKHYVNSRKCVLLKIFPKLKSHSAVCVKLTTICLRQKSLNKWGGEKERKKERKKVVEMAENWWLAKQRF